MKHKIDLFRAKIVEDEAKRAFVPATIPPGGIDLRSVLERAKGIVFRQISVLETESSQGILCKDSSIALINYIKQIKDLIKDENELLDSMSDEELKKLAE